MLQPLALIVNPTAGLSAVHAASPARKRVLAAAVQDLNRRYAVQLFLEKTSRAVEVRARQSVQDGIKVLVAAGGDGTVNAVVNGMMQAERPLGDVSLGVLPLGTGNVFAFNMGIPRDRRAACRLIRQGKTRKIDLGIATSFSSTRRNQKPETRNFLLMTGIGYDAKVIEDTSLRLKYVLRDFAYVIKTLENVVRHQGTQVTLRFDDEKVYANTAWLVMVGNAASYAWKIKVTPHARVDDGLLDVCLMPFENKLMSVQQALQVLTGQHIDRGIAQYWQVKKVRVESSPPVPVQLDGDEWGSTPVELSLLPRTLNVLAPAAVQ